MKTEIKKLTATDTDTFTAMLQMFAKEFDIEDLAIPNENYVHDLLAKDTFIVFAATDKGNVIGGLTAHILPSYYGESAEAYLYDLAVSAEHQRMGIGKQLLDAFTAYCKEQDIPAFFVQADDEDAHAHSFYRNTGGLPTNVVHYTYIV